MNVHGFKNLTKKFKVAADSVGLKVFKKEYSIFI